MAQKNNRPIFGYLTLNGAGVQQSMNGAASEDFEYICPAGIVTKIEEIIFSISDASMVADEFGGIAALTTGLTLVHADSADATINDLLAGVNLKSNYDLARFGELEIVAGTTNDCLTVRYKLPKPIVLQPTEKIRCVAADDLSGLTEMYIAGKGFAWDEELF
jgi:hypothetical protein